MGRAALVERVEGLQRGWEREDREKKSETHVLRARFSLFFHPDSAACRRLIGNQAHFTGIVGIVA